MSGYSAEQVDYFYRSIYGDGPTVLSGDEMVRRLAQAGVSLDFPKVIYKVGQSAAERTRWNVKDGTGKTVASFFGKRAEEFAREHAEYLIEDEVVQP